MKGAERSYQESLTHIEAEKDVSSFYTAPVIFIA